MCSRCRRPTPASSSAGARTIGERPLGEQHGDDQRCRRADVAVGRLDHRAAGRVGQAHVLSARTARGDGPRVRGGVRAQARGAGLHAAARRATASRATGARRRPTTGHSRLRRVRAQAGRGVRAGRESRRADVRLCRARRSTVWLATSTGLRRRHSDRIGKVEITAKTPDFSRSSWTGMATRDFRDVDPGALFDSARAAARVVGAPNRAAGRALRSAARAVVHRRPCDRRATTFMTRRDADEGRSPYSRARRAARGSASGCLAALTMYSDPDEPGISDGAVLRRRRLRRGLRRSSTTACRLRGPSGCGTASSARSSRRATGRPRRACPNPCRTSNNLIVDGRRPAAGRDDRGHGAGAARHVLLVHPHGGSSDGAADRAHARRRVPGRERQGRRAP